MSLTKSRKILSVILSILMAIGGVLFFSSTLIKCTLCNETYVTKIFSSQALYLQCKNNFTERTAAIEAKSGIPSRVFEAILEKKQPANKTAVQRIFTNNNPSLYDEDLVDEFEELCLEYLKGNSINYKKKSIRSTAVYAAEIYSDCFGIHNSENIRNFINKINTQYGKYASSGLLLFTVSAALSIILFNKKDYILRLIYSALTALGLSLLAIGVCAFIFGIANNPMLGPQHYADALSKAINSIFAIIAVTGILITALSVSGSVVQYKKSKRNNE